MHGGDDQDPPLPTRLQVRPGVAREQERARQQHRQQRVPAVLVERVERRDVLEARVRDESVDAPELLDRGCDRSPVPLPRRQVGGERLAGPAGSGSRSTASTCQPSSTRRCAIARPMPLAAPVMSARRAVTGLRGRR